MIPQYIIPSGTQGSATLRTPVVFVVDDDYYVRESLAGLIRSEGFEAALFPSAQSFLADTRKVGPGCLVLDVNLPDLNGLELQRRITADTPQMPVIFITGYGDVPTTVEAFKAGAVEFLQKPVEDHVIRDAIRTAVERSRDSIERDSESADLRRRFATLSIREREVFTLVVLGLMNKQVGGKLGISEITVKAHRGRMTSKMGARSLADLVKMAAALGLQTGSGS